MQVRQRSNGIRQKLEEFSIADLVSQNLMVLSQEQDMSAV